MRRSLSAAIAAVFFANSCIAAQAGSPYDIFHRHCLSPGPYFERTVVLAKDRSWTPLANDMAVSLTPVENPVALEGWIVGDGESGGSFEAVVVSKSTIGGKAVEGCTVAFTDVNAEAFELSLKNLAAARPAGETRGQDSLHKAYTASVGGRELAITVTLPLYPKGSDQVVVSVVAEQQLEN